MAGEHPDAIKLDGPLTLELPDGSFMRVRPGPYGKGVAFIPLADAKAAAASTGRVPGKRGRRPRPGTVALREQLMRDVKAKKVKDTSHYVKWILARDDGLSVAVARQIVYRELRKAQA